VAPSGGAGRRQPPRHLVGKVRTNLNTCRNAGLSLIGWFLRTRSKYLNRRLFNSEVRTNIYLTELYLCHIRHLFEILSRFQMHAFVNTAFKSSCPIEIKELLLKSSPRVAHFTDEKFPEPLSPYGDTMKPMLMDVPCPWGRFFFA